MRFKTTSVAHVVFQEWGFPTLDGRIIRSRSGALQPDESEAEARASENGISDCTIRASHLVGLIAPAPAPIYPIRLAAVHETVWIGARRTARASSNVLTPLGHISQHVIEPEPIGLKGGGRSAVDEAVIAFVNDGIGIRLLHGPIGHIGIAAGVIGRVAPEPGCLGSGPSSVFPLVLLGQAECSFALSRQPIGHGFGVIP